MTTKKLALFQKKNTTIKALTASSALLLSVPAFAASELESKVQNLGNLVVNVLTVASVLIGTAAVILLGLKYFSGRPEAKEQMWGLGVGALLCFAAPAIMQALKTAVA